MEIVELEAFTVIGFPVRAGWDELWTEMPKAWLRFFTRHSEIEHQVDNAFVDVSLGKRGNEYLQLICTRVARVDRVPDGMRAITIPRQTYVHHRHVGPAEAIAESFGRMYAWAEREGYPAGVFKVDMGYTPAGDEQIHQLYIGMLPAQHWSDVSP